MANEMEVLLTIKEDIGEIKGEIKNIHEKLKQQNGNISKQIENCNNYRGEIYERISDNTGFRNWVKGGLAAIGGLSAVTALIVIIRMLAG